jgi:hypothetical protein
MHPHVSHLIRHQDGIVARRQVLPFLTEGEIAGLLGKYWQVILPGVYATFTGPLTGRHHAQAALLHAGDGAMLSDSIALRAYGVPYVPADPLYRVLVADDNQRSSRDFVVVRRTKRLPTPRVVQGLPTAPLPRALCEFAQRHEDERDALAVVAAAIQRRQVSIEEFAAEIERSPSRGRRRLMRIFGAIASGIRSAPENDIRELVRTSRILPEPKYNWLIELPGGEKISPDLMIIEAALIHETNGREHHSDELAGEDPFEDMQRRADVLTTTGFTVLMNAPRRISVSGAHVLTELETCFLRDNGKGLPPGVRILRAGPPYSGVTQRAV